MSRRIDIELTSVRDDGTWTWRAAGAKQPKGVLDGKLLYEGAKTGEVVRAEADFEIEGITIISILPPKEKRSEPDRLEIVGPAQAQQPLVTSSLVPKQERRGRDRDRDRDRDGAPRGPRREGDRGPRSGRPPRAEGEDRGGRGRGEGGDRARTGAGDRTGGRGEGRRSEARPESRGPRGEGRPPRAPQPE